MNLDYLAGVVTGAVVGVFFCLAVIFCYAPERKS